VVEENQTKEHANDAQSGEGDGIPPYLRGVFIAGAWGFISLLLTAIFWPNLTERMKFFTSTLWILVTTFAVIAQVVIYRKQWQVMDRALYVSERPYVVVYGISVTNLPFEADKLIVYEVKIENKGKTPAYNVVFRTYIDVEPHLLPEEPIYREIRTRDSRMTLAMNTPATAKQTDLNDILTQEQIEAIKNDKLFVYIWGIVRYREGFTDETHYTKFYLVYDPEEKRFTAGGHHNDMT
jgi:hypothetical protein